MTAKITMLKFESKTCPMCAQLNRRGTVETIKGEFPQLDVTTIVIPSSDEELSNAKLNAAYELSEDLGVQSLPTLIFRDEQGNELGRLDGAPSLTQLRKAMEEVQGRIDERTEVNAALAAFLAMPA